MADAIITTADAAPPVETVTPAALEAPAEITAELSAPADDGAAAERLAEVAKIGSTFGADLALASLVESFDFATAQQRHTEQLEHRVAQLEAPAPEISGAAPVSPSSPAPDQQTASLESRIGPNLALFAKSLKLA